MKKNPGPQKGNKADKAKGSVKDSKKTDNPKATTQLKSTVTGKGAVKQTEDKTCFKSKENPKVTEIKNADYQCIKTIKGHGDSIECLIIIDDTRIASGGYDCLVKLWDLQDMKKLEKPIKVYKGHEDAVFSILKFTAFKLISCSRDKTIRIWNIEDGRQLACITGKEPYYVVKQISDAQVAAAGGDNEIRVFNLWNEEETKEEFVLTGHTNVINDIEVFQDNILCSGGECMLILIWDLAKRKHIGTLEGHKAAISSLLRLKEGLLASGSYDQTIRIWDIKKKSCCQILEGGTDKIMSVGQLPNGCIVSGGSEWNLVIWGKNNKIENELEGHEGSVNTILVLPYGMIVTGSADNNLKFWK